MNFQLDDAVEFIDGKAKGDLGEVFIRCNNVLWVGKPTDGDEPTAQATAMEAE